MKPFETANAINLLNFFYYYVLFLSSCFHDQMICLSQHQHTARLTHEAGFEKALIWSERD